MSGDHSPTSSTPDAANGASPCPICNGMGFVVKDVPVGHPDFGKAFPCTCQEDALRARQTAQIRRMSNLDALADKTFASFQLDLPGLDEKALLNLRLSFDRARQYAAEPHGWLLFQGNFGSGKTHLAAAIANLRLEQGDRVLFVTLPDLLDHLRAAFGPSSEVAYDELFEQVRMAPLLILDDLGAESATPWAQEKLFQLINHRYLHELPTVITTNCELNTLDPRIRSRLVDWNLTQSVNMQLPDYRRVDVAQEASSISSLSLYGEMVFETFDLREDTLPSDERRNLREAYEIARGYAANPDQWLLFMGDHGCGKTHLAAAIANYRQAMGEHVILVTAPDLLDYLRAAFNPNVVVSFDKRFHEIRSVPLLVIDQLDLTNASPWAREKIRQIVDHRYLSRAATVFTTTQPLEEIDPQVRSRLLDTRRCHMFAITVPDYMGGIRRRRPAAG